MLMTVLVVLAAFGQVSAEPLSFEVASVRRVVSHSAAGTSMTDGSERISYRNVPLLHLLMRAYGVKAYEIVGPDWLSIEGYDVMATMPAGTKKEQIPAMLRRLLADRLRIGVHRETRQQQAYVLVVGKSGPTLKRSEETGSADLVGFSSGGHLKARTLSSLAGFLSALMDRPVIDMTGIQGRFDIELDVSMDDLPRLQRVVSNIPSIATSGQDEPQARASESRPLGYIFTAVQNLGLKLESRKVPMEFLVVDKAEKDPTAN
jgi:uncharacterized protein (TIGR03435 family)